MLRVILSVFFLVLLHRFLIASVPTQRPMRCPYEPVERVRLVPMISMVCSKRFLPRLFLRGRLRCFNVRDRGVQNGNPVFLFKNVRDRVTGCTLDNTTNNNDEGIGGASITEATTSTWGTCPLTIEIRLRLVIDLVAGATVTEPSSLTFNPWGTRVASFGNNSTGSSTAITNNSDPASARLWHNSTFTFFTTNGGIRSGTRTNSASGGTSRKKRSNQPSFF